MFDEPNESPAEKPLDPADQARERADEFRVHAQLAATFEGVRKYDARVLPGLNSDIARDIQRTMGRLEKTKMADLPALPKASVPDAERLLKLPETADLSTNDYHVHRRLGEVMIGRWLEGDQVATFYERLQAHFDVAMEHYREEEKTSHEWKQDAKTLAYLKALDGIKVSMAERYLRELIKKLRVFVLSTQSADEIDILHLCDYVMGVPAAEVVGEKSAPPEEPTERDRAWYFKLFSLRGLCGDVERMCFFAYLQKSDDEYDLTE